MKKTDIEQVALYFATRDKNLLVGVELPATVKAIVEKFDETKAEKHTVSNAVGVIGNSVVENVKWVRQRISTALK